MTRLNLTTTLAITKTVGKKRQPVGTVTVPMPDLEQIKVLLASDPLERVSVGDDGIPEYAGDFASWLMRCVRGAVQATARNRLVTGTTQLRPGASIPATMADVTAPPVMGGNGEALAQLTALKKQFKAYADALGKAPKTTMLIVECFNSPKAFLLQPQEVQAKIEPYFAGFLDSVDNAALSSTQLAYFDKFVGGDDDEGDLFDDL
jgi:hypothetical protein